MTATDTGPAASPLTDRLRMHGRHAMVTGAASGLGRAITERLLESGAHVTLLDTDEAGLDRAAAELGHLAGSLSVQPCDIAQVDQVEAAVDGAARAQDRLDCVFANAGIAGGAGIDSPEGRLYDLDWDRLHKTLSVNLVGTMATVRAAARAMRPARRGSIVVTVSTAGLRADSMVGYGYIVSKGAMANFVRQAAVDLAPDGIRVNGIAPGPFHTNIGGPGPADPEMDRAWARTVLLRRLGQPHEIQGIALLLASDASSFMTGAVYPVDGGTLAGIFPPTI